MSYSYCTYLMKEVGADNLWLHNHCLFLGRIGYLAHCLVKESRVYYDAHISIFTKGKYLTFSWKKLLFLCYSLYISYLPTWWKDPMLYSIIQMHHMYMSHFAYACKMRYPLNLVLENSEYLWFYWTFCIVILDYGLKLHKLSNHILGMLQKWLEIH